VSNVSPVFMAAAAGLAVTPGAGTLYVVARTLKGGWREGAATVLGTTSGGVAHVLVVALGGAALLERCPSSLRVVSILGGVYLGYLAFRGLASGRTGPVPSEGSGRRAFADGLLVALLNPSTALFLLAFLPQFVVPSSPMLPQLLGLGAITIGLNCVAHLTWLAISAAIGEAAVQRAERQRQWLRIGASAILLVLAGYAVARAF
jgi:threonine/homoserine/homoserine lactone efflux protein